MSCCKGNRAPKSKCVGSSFTTGNHNIPLLVLMQIILCIAEHFTIHITLLLQWTVDLSLIAKSNRPTQHVGYAPFYKPTNIATLIYESSSWWKCRLVMARSSSVRQLTFYRTNRFVFTNTNSNYLSHRLDKNCRGL